jgi:Sugar (and other) transporter
MAVIDEKVAHHEHLEAGRDVRRTSIGQLSFDKRNSLTIPQGRRESIRKSFDKANLAMVFPDTTHVEISDDVSDGSGSSSIDDLPISWYVWLVAATASIAGSLFGYDTGIISAVLVYLNNDLNNRPVTSSEKELITSLCSGGAFIGAIIAGLTADQVFHTTFHSEGARTN